MEPADVYACTQHTFAEVGYVRLTEHFDWYPGQGWGIAEVLEADRPTCATDNGIWSERAEIGFRQPLPVGSSVVLEFWLPSPTSEVTLSWGDQEFIFKGSDSDRATGRFSVADAPVVPQIRLARAAIAGLTVTQSQLRTPRRTK